MDDLTKAFLGAALALLGNVVLQLWRYFRAAYSKRVDDACELIAEASDAASAYWIREKPSRTESNADHVNDLDLEEVKIEGLQEKLNLARVLVEGHLSPHARDRLVELMSDLQDGMTSGAFAEPTRTADRERAKQIQRHATALIVHLRTAAAHAVSFSGIVRNMALRRSTAVMRAPASIRLRASFRRHYRRFRHRAYRDDL